MRSKFKGTNKSLIQEFGLGGMNVEAHYKYNKNYNNIIEARPITKSVKYHPTQKDLHTMQSLVETFSMPGHIVFDPFMGSCSTGVAALSCNRKFIGIERDTNYYNIAVERIRLASQQKLKMG